MKKSLLSLMAIVMLAACSDKDNPEPEEIQEEYTVLGWDMKLSNEDDSTFFRFTYNADSTVKETKEWDKNDNGEHTYFTYAKYENGKFTWLESSYGLSPAKTPEATYYYNENGKLSKIQHWRAGSWVYYYDSIVYNAAGKVSEMYSKYNQADEAIWDNKKYILTWTGGNISKVEKYGINSNGDGTFQLETTEVYTVDNKPNLFGKILKDDYLWRTDNTSFEFLGENNVIKVEETEAGTDRKDVRTGTFTYDEQNKLAKIKNVFEFYSGTTLNRSHSAELVLVYEKK